MLAKASAGHVLCLVESREEQLPELGQSELCFAEENVPEGTAAAPEEATAAAPAAIAEGTADHRDLLQLVGMEAALALSLAELEHPVTAYLNELAPSSRRPQLAALEAIARRSTQVFTAETMPWHRLRRPQVDRRSVHSERPGRR